MKFVFLLALIFSLQSFSSERPRYDKKSYILKLAHGYTLNDIGLQGQARNLFGNLYVVQGSYDLASSKLQKSAAVEYVQPNYYANRKNKLPTPIYLDAPLKGNPSQSSMNDPYLSQQWALKDASSNGMSVISAHQSRNSRNREEIIVAVVDTGVDYNHEDLNMWKNPGEIPGNNIDDDNNGYVDDIYGINTLVRDSNGKATVDMMDAHGHGTHVSGSIAAIQNNGKGVVGVAKNVKIMGIRTVPNSSDELDVDVIEAFIYAAVHGAKVINCSFGKAHNEGGMAVKEAIDFIGKEYGVLVVAAAGNDSKNIDNSPTYPASFDSENLLVVASTSSSGGMSYFSNYGERSVDLAAPGSSITSSLPRNRYGSMSGTSMASPNTAGVAAEVLSQHPNLSPVELKEVLMKSVSKVSRFSGKVGSGGRVDLEKSLQELEK